MNKQKIIEFVKENKKIVIVGVFIIFALIFGNSNAYDKPSMYQFPANDLITMDVVKNDGIEGGGTFVCTSAQRCLDYVRSAEARGATQYCKTIDIRKNGRRIWFKRYQ